MRASRLILLLVSVLTSGVLSAQTTLYWDPNGLTAGTGTGGGTWDSSTLNWTTSGAGDISTVGWLNDGTVRAVFPISSTVGTDSYNAGGSYTIDAATGIQVRGMGLGSTVWGPSSTTTFSGVGSITLTDPLVTVEAVTAVFNVPLLSMVGLTLDKSFNFGGTLRLNIANPDLQGVTAIANGTLVYNTTGALGPETTGTSNSIEIGNGTLQFNSAVGGNFSYSLAEPIKF